jgi:hypothetical protein
MGKAVKLPSSFPHRLEFFVFPLMREINFILLVNYLCTLIFLQHYASKNLKVGVRTNKFGFHLVVQMLSLIEVPVGGQV